jgi:hypothetical protein
METNAHLHRSMVMLMMVVMLMTGIEGVVGDGVERTYRLDNPRPVFTEPCYRPGALFHFFISFISSTHFIPYSSLITAMSRFVVVVVVNFYFFIDLFLSQFS